jgi:hypothetical protein
MMRLIRFISDNMYGVTQNDEFHENFIKYHKKMKTTPPDPRGGQKFCNLTFDFLTTFSTGIIMKYLQFYRETKKVSTWYNEIIAIKFIFRRYKPRNNKFGYFYIFLKIIVFLNNVPQHLSVPEVHLKVYKFK